MKKSWIFFLTIITLCWGLAANAQQAYQQIEVTNGGTIKGVVKFAGPAPKPETLPVTKNQEVCGDHKLSEALVVGSNGGLANVVVSIEGITQGKKLPPAAQAAVLDNNKCVFIPHVQAMVAGGKVEIKNSDPILHNTHAFLGGKATAFNLAFPIQGQKVNKKIKKAGIMNVQCDAGHTWMSAYILVKDHPYFAVTGDNGAFEITDVPPGTYKVQAWHEKLDAQVKDVTVAEKEAAEINFEFK